MVSERFALHCDYLNPENSSFAQQKAERGQRIATALIYLNEGFEGAETDFPGAGFRFKGAEGDGVFFWNVLPDGKSDPLTLHAGLPPAAGEKWLRSQWIRGRVPLA